jgi:hypothetical protein
MDEVVILGDLVDSRRESCAGEGALWDVWRVLEGLLSGAWPRCTLLCGNHDWKYWQGRERLSGQWMRPTAADTLWLALHDLSAGVAAVLFDDEREGHGDGETVMDVWGQRVELVAARRGWLISHAGVSSRLWPCGAELEAGAAALNEEFEQLKLTADMETEHPLTQAGVARGGAAACGGPLWMDWEAEFADDLPFPQLVGHSIAMGHRRKGRSYCIDTGQNCYAVIDDDGRLQCRYLYT